MRIEQLPDLGQAEPPQRAQFRNGTHAPKLAVLVAPIAGYRVGNSWGGQQPLAFPVPQHAPRDTSAMRELSDTQHVDPPHQTASHSVKVNAPRESRSTNVSGQYT